jgi:hypothetical protein
MTAPVISVVSEPAPLAGEAAELVADAFPVPFLEMNAAYIAWALGARFDPARLPLAGVARHDGRLVGFVGAAARPFRVGGHAETGYVATFLATARDHRGGSLVSGFYGMLIEQIAAIDAPVLTFTLEGSVGDLVTIASYRRAGFIGRRLEPYVTWGAARGRVKAGDPVRQATPAVTLELDIEQASAHLDADPRGSRELDRHARATAAWQRTARGREPVLILEVLPTPLNAATLGDAVEQAFAAFPEHNRILTVPGMPESAAPIAESVGLRRLSVPPYHPWVWAPRSDHPALQAERTTHPIL